MKKLKGIVNGQQVEVKSGRNRGLIGTVVVIDKEGITVRLSNGELDFNFASEL